MTIAEPCHDHLGSILSAPSWHSGEKERLHTDLSGSLPSLPSFILTLTGSKPHALSLILYIVCTEQDSFTESERKLSAYLLPQENGLDIQQGLLVLMATSLKIYVKIRGIFADISMYIYVSTSGFQFGKHCLDFPVFVCCLGRFADLTLMSWWSIDHLKTEEGLFLAHYIHMHYRNCQYLSWYFNTDFI